MGYGDYLEERGADTQRLGILEALGEQEPNPVRLLERLEELQLILQQHTTQGDTPFLLSTIHSSKGLEYDRVFLMDVMDGVLPKEGQDVDLDEERRLFYVGMTRAKDELSIFTFQKAESAFSGFLFPKETPKTAAIRPQPKAVSARRAAPTQTAEQLRQAVKDLTAPCEIVHSKFGPGILLEKQGDIARIRFADETTRKLSLYAAFQAGVLKVK